MAVVRQPFPIYTVITTESNITSFLGFATQSQVLKYFLITFHREREAIEEEHHSQSGRALLDSQAQGTATSGGSAGENEGGAQGSLVAVEQTQASGHGASNGMRSSGDIGKLAIVDCRSVATVWGNSFKGGGTEDEG